MPKHVNYSLRPSFYVAKMIPVAVQMPGSGDPNLNSLRITQSKTLDKEPLCLIKMSWDSSVELLPGTKHTGLSTPHT